MIDIKKLFVILALIIFLPNIYGVDLEHFDITIDIISQNEYHVVEKWKVNYSETNDKMDFQQKVLNANLDISELEQINSKLKPHIYINNYYDLSIGYDEVNDFVRFEYYSNDLSLIKYYENNNQLLWKFNENLLNFLVVNNLYYISKNSLLEINVDPPYVIQEPIPDASYTNDSLVWSGISSNELRLLILEPKPPKASLIFENDVLLIRYLFFVIVIALIVFFVFKKYDYKIKEFVIRNSIIKPKKKKKDVFED